MKKFPFESTFSSVIKPIISEEKDKYLALASLEEVKAFLPHLDTKVNHDLLPIAFNACVVNRVNKNDDVIDTDTAIAIYKNFIFKQINAEHNRHHVVGVILTAGFSEFGTDKPMTEEQARATKEPFNITLGGVVWRVVDNHVASDIEDAGDPTSENYMKISASWELGFTGYGVAILPAGQKNLTTGQLISEATEVEKVKENLKALGGKGLLEDGRRIYRQPLVEVLPLGIGVTENPAAEVKGIATEENAEAKASENKEIISQPAKTDVTIGESIIMPITSIKDITDESLKQATASVISDVLAAEIAAKAKEWEAEKGKLDKKLEAAVATHESLKKDYEALQATMKTLEATVNSLNSEKVEREKVEKFNARMGEINEAYELDDEVRAAIVEEVKALASDEAFDTYKKKAAILFKGFAKKAPPFVKEGEKKEGEKEEHKEECAKKSKASDEAKAAVDAAVDNADKEKGGLPNTSSSEKKSLKETFNSAFAFTKENWSIKH
jgi:predicted  nucleic acid-binding Zn-ribbon protein